MARKKRPKVIVQYLMNDKRAVDILIEEMQEHLDNKTIKNILVNADSKYQHLVGQENAGVVTRTLVRKGNKQVKQEKRKFYVYNGGG